MRQRWFGSTGTRVPELAVEGDAQVPLAEALVLENVDDIPALREAHELGRPVVVRADTPEKILAALRRPEVASVIVPEAHADLVDLDLRALTYG